MSNAQQKYCCDAGLNIEAGLRYSIRLTLVEPTKSSTFLANEHQRIFNQKSTKNQRGINQESTPQGTIEAPLPSVYDLYKIRTLLEATCFRTRQTITKATAPGAVAFLLL